VLVVAETLCETRMGSASSLGCCGGGSRMSIVLVAAVVVFVSAPLLFFFVLKIEATEFACRVPRWATQEYVPVVCNNNNNNNNLAARSTHQQCPMSCVPSKHARPLVVLPGIYPTPRPPWTRVDCKASMNPFDTSWSYLHTSAYFNGTDANASSLFERALRTTARSNNHHRFRGGGGRGNQWKN
jgi:hypothetical protein